MKKRIKVLIIVVIILLVSYFGFKGYNLFYYSANKLTIEDFETFVTHFKISDKINIKHKVVESNEYFEYQNVKIRNDFKDFETLQESIENVSPKLGLKDENNNVKASFWMGTDDPYLLYLLKSNKTLNGIEDEKITSDILSDIFEKNNITNDIELFDYLSNQKYVKNNIFDSVKKMKENYAIRYMVSVIGTMANITLIEGDYTGYILDFINSKEVSILKNDKRYIFTFINSDYFTDEYIKDLLNTIIINDENNSEDIPKKHFDLVIDEENNCNLKLNEYYNYEDRKVYTSCINEIYVENESGNKITLEYHLKNINQSFDRSIKQLVSDLTVFEVLKDGGTTIYKKDNYTIIVCNTVNGNKDIYIGNKDFKYEQGYCK